MRNLAGRPRVAHYILLVITLIRPLPRIMTAAVFKIINALSFQILATINQPIHPANENTWSYNANSGFALVAIAIKRSIELPHLIYQSTV